MSAVFGSRVGAAEAGYGENLQAISGVRPMVSGILPTGPAAADRSLIELQDRFINAWERMAASFAMDRTLGRVHALIYISLQPVDLETIAVRLALPRERCAELAAELTSWGLISQVGDGGVARYAAEQDPWSWFLRTVRERYEREFLPLQQSVRHVLELAQQLAQRQPELAATVQRVERFSRFIDEFMRFIDAFVNLGAKPMAAVLKTVAKLMPRGRRL